MFKDDTQRGDESVLDAVLSEAKDLRRQISVSDQRKLDEYLDSVRDVEQRIEQAGIEASYKAIVRFWTSPTYHDRLMGFRKTSPIICD